MQMRCSQASSRPRLPPQVEHAVSWVWWSSIEGDIKRIDGEYRFEDQGDATTRMTFTLDVDPGMFVPGPVKKMLTEGMARNSVRDLKKRVEGG